MALVGYARVSSVGQSLEVQEDLLRAAGCEKVFAEKRSGRTTDGREELASALEWVREGDVLVVTRPRRHRRCSFSPRNFSLPRRHRSACSLQTDDEGARIPPPRRSCAGAESHLRGGQAPAGITPRGDLASLPGTRSSARDQEAYSC